MKRGVVAPEVATAAPAGSIGKLRLLVCILACRVASAGASPKLSALSFVGDVATLTPAFDSDTLSYNASVTTDRTSVQLAYAVASPDSASLVEVTTAVTQPSGGGDGTC